MKYLIYSNIHIIANRTLNGSTGAVFVQVNALMNNLSVVNDLSSEGTDGDFDVSITAGLAFSF